jgi:hypothetical protein
MKTNLSRMLIVLLLLSAVLTVAASPGYQKPKMTPFSGKEVSTGLINPGTVKVVDGKTITRGLVVTAIDTMSDPRVSGDVTTVANSIYVGDSFTGIGPLWGSIHITNPHGGWTIGFTGKQSAGCQTVVHALGWGEGDYRGLTAVWEYKSNNCMFTSTVTGYIVERH